VVTGNEADLNMLFVESPQAGAASASAPDLLVGLIWLLSFSCQLSVLCAVVPIRRHELQVLVDVV